MVGTEGQDDWYDNEVDLPEAPGSDNILSEEQAAGSDKLSDSELTVRQKVRNLVEKNVIVSDYILNCSFSVFRGTIQPRFWQESVLIKILKI